METAQNIDEMDAGLLEQEEEATPQVTLIPLRFVGAGLIFTWDWCLTDSSVSDFFGNDALPQAFAWGFPISMTLTFLLCAFLARTISAVSNTPALHWSAFAGGVLGALLSLLHISGATGLVGLDVISGVLCGYSSALLLMMWAEAYSRLHPSQVMLFGVLSLAVAGGAFLLITQLSPVVRMTSRVVVPLISFACCYASLRYVGRPSSQVRRYVRYSFPWKPMLIVAVCGMCAAFVDIALFGQGVTPRVTADTVIGLVLLVVLYLGKNYVKPVVLVYAALVLITVGVVAVAFLGSSAAFATSFLTMASYAIITLFAFALLANISARYGVPTLWLFGWAGAVRTIFEHLGGFAMNFLPFLSNAQDSPLMMAMLCVVALVFIGAVTMLWLSEKSFSSNWAIETIALNAQTGKPEPEPEPEMTLLDRCQAVAGQSGLTERETEILELLVQKLTYREICQALFVSQNTLKTHVRHIYAKLQVANREEAIALVEAVH